jgi:hypothetical protein
MEYTCGMAHAPANQSLRPGSLIVVAILLVGITAATVAVAYQRLQTHRCLDFYGPEAARQVAKAPRVELWQLAPAGRPGRLVATGRHDVTSAKGIVHLRRGLVEDVGFRWSEVGLAGRLPEAAWDYALVFSNPTLDGRTTIVIDLEADGGWLAVQGQAGRVALGRLGSGLAAWIAATIPAADKAEPR